MVFLVALIVTAVLLFVLWRSIGPDAAKPGSGPSPRPVRRPTRRPVLPPDDNPDFLRDLSRRPRPEQ